MFFLSALARGTFCYGSNVARERTAKKKKKKKKKKNLRENLKHPCPKWMTILIFAAQCYNVNVTEVGA